jgi:hypothetical protein
MNTLRSSENVHVAPVRGQVTMLLFLDAISCIAYSNASLNRCASQTGDETYLERIYVPIWKCHGHVVSIHDLSSDSTYNSRIKMMAERYLFTEFAQSKWWRFGREGND